MVTAPDPLAKYHVSDEDMEGTVYYYGYVDSGGAWYIMEYDRTDETATTYRYLRGHNNYASSWDQRRNLTFKRFDEVF